MIQPKLEDFKLILNRLHELRDERDRLIFANTPPWNKEVLDEFDRIKYWVGRYEGVLLRMREYDREKQWHGG